MRIDTGDRDKAFSCWARLATPFIEMADRMTSALVIASFSDSSPRRDHICILWPFTSASCANAVPHAPVPKTVRFIGVDGGVVIDGLGFEGVVVVADIIEPVEVVSGKCEQDELAEQTSFSLPQAAAPLLLLAVY